MKLVIVHFHLRPGGVRRVIEEGARNLVASDAMNISAIALASGERPDDVWRDNFQCAVSPVPVRHFINPAFGYISEQRIKPSRIAREIHSAMKGLFEGSAGECVVWFHNSGLGRNLLLVRELERAFDEQDIPLIAHHHDWWFDNRWQRWPESFAAASATRRCRENYFPRNTARCPCRNQFHRRGNTRRELPARPSHGFRIPSRFLRPSPRRAREARARPREQLGTDAPVSRFFPAACCAGKISPRRFCSRDGCVRMRCSSRRAA